MAVLSVNTNFMALTAANSLDTHYARLAKSVQRLSSGLRVNSAADDAAGLAIRELMRADVATFHQGVRNANDAISMIQTADGALAVIDEKLIRMKELAEQAATGTYNSTQRLIIHSEFVAMAEEIDRIANATDFNGIKLLDGSLTGAHDGSGLNATGKMKIHFGTGNESAEDYYYVEIGNCTLAGLGLRDEAVTTINAAAANAGGIKAAAGNGTKAAGPGGNLGNLPTLGNVLSNGVTYITRSHSFAFAVIPKGATDVRLHLDDLGGRDGLELFTPAGVHIAGTTLANNGWQTQFWADTGHPTGGVPLAPLETWAITPANGFDNGAVCDNSVLNGIPGGGDVTHTPGTAGNKFTYNGMNIGYSGGGKWSGWGGDDKDYMTIDVVTEDLILCLVGDGPCWLTATWTNMPDTTGGNQPNPPDPPDPPDPPGPGPDPALPQGDIISIKTQEKAQQALERIDNAIVKKDNVRAHLGAMQNRLENTVTNLSIQAENLQAAESRISDVDVATEMTQFVRNQILTQSAVAMLGQANSYPHMLMTLLNG